MMQEPPLNPVSRANLTRASVVGAVLGVVAIILFVALWVVLGDAGMSPIARLLLSLCLPPALIAGLVGLYVLIKRPRP